MVKYGQVNKVLQMIYHILGILLPFAFGSEKREILGALPVFFHSRIDQNCSLKMHVCFFVIVSLCLLHLRFFAQ